MVNRRFLSNDNPNFYDYLKQNNFWFEFYNRINNYEFYEDVLNLLLENKDHNQNSILLIIIIIFIKRIG